MKSTSGEHYIALDHVRAIATLLVFTWHFTHGAKGYPVPFEGSPFWGPLVLFDEGHVGVALFMTLSGYLFAKLLNDKSEIRYHFFLLNRVIRLFPLLALIFILNAIVTTFEAKSVDAGYLAILNLGKGFIFPTWPNGGWSVTTELHFYLLLPILLFLKKKSPVLLLFTILLTFGYRIYFFVTTGEVQSIAYWTILGRLDQFILGILGFHWSNLLRKQHLLIAFVFSFFLSVYYWFDTNGGFYLTGGYPSPSSLWVWLPTIEGMTCAALIAWYETSFDHQNGFISTAFSKIGEYSYSIYLFHTFFVFSIAKFINENIVDISNFYVAFPVSLLAFCMMIPVGFLSMKFIELPFLRYRKPYYKSRGAISH
jgi:peptidoglycan/LPS O-acetylase OafA/YrhL